MFKTSVVTDEISQDLETAIKFATEFGLEAVELRRVWDKPPQELLGDINRIKKILEENHLNVSAVASPFFKASIDDPVEYEEHLNILRKCIELAEALDCDIVRGFTFWREGTLDDRLEEIVEKYQKPLDIVESSEIILGIENEPSTFVGNGRECKIFLDELNSSQVKSIWDPGNDIWDDLGEVPYPDGYNLIKNEIVHVHIKDGLRGEEKGNYRFVAFGEGEVDYRGQLKALKKDGYTGYLSLETHWRLDMESIQGSVDINDTAFSSLGEASSKICIQNLQHMLKELMDEK
jgi:sugar phosphate isomerase/epimerase